MTAAVKYAVEIRTAAYGHNLFVLKINIVRQKVMYARFRLTVVYQSPHS